MAKIYSNSGLEISEVLSQLRNSVAIYEELIHKMDEADIDKQGNNLKAKIVERLIGLRQQAKDLEQHLSSDT